MAVHYPFARTAIRTALIGITATAALSACGAEYIGRTTEIAASAPTSAATPSSAPGEVSSPPAAAPAKPAATTSKSTKTTTKKPSTTKKSSSTDTAVTGTRQVVIAPIPSFESILALDAKNRLNLIDGESDRSLFVFTPVGKRYLIMTAKADAGSSEPSCLSIKVNGSNPLTVVAAACDAGAAGQLFKVTARGKNYAISNRSAFLQVIDGRLIAQELGDAPLETTFQLVDNGKANLPALD